MSADSFLNSTRIVLVGMGVAQAIPLLGSLLIARLYLPAEFGIFSTWLGTVMVAAILVTGRLETALAIEPDGRPREIAVAATLATIGGASIGLFIITLPVLWYGSRWGVSAALLLATVPAALLMATAQTWQSWGAAEGRYRELSWIRVSQSLGITTLQIALAFLSPTAESLVAGQMLGLAVGVMVAMKRLPLSREAFSTREQFVKALLDFWQRHRKLPMYSLPADFINSAAGQLPLLFISNRFGVDASGVYALAVRIIGGPISLLGAAVLDVFKRRAASSFREHGHCRTEYRQTFLILAGAGLTLVVAIFVLAESFFVVAFGEIWRQAGTISVWLAPMFALRFVASPLSYVFYIAGAQRTDLVWQCALLFMTLATMAWSGDFKTAVIAYSTGYSALYVIYLFLSGHYSRGVRA